MKNGPLVSIVVLSYNSSRTILETLDSINKQTYSNIELVIADDASKDNTREICQEWIKKNKDRFSNVLLNECMPNVGVTQNLANGVSLASGEWIKPIAGDDLLTPECCSVFVDYILENLDTQIVFGNTIAFKDVNGERVFIDNNLKRDLVSFSKLTVKEQCAQLLSNNGLPATCSFIRRNLFLRFPLDIKYRNIEDWPYWIKLTKNGIHIDFIDRDLALYRREESVSTHKKIFWNLSYATSVQRFYNDLIVELENTNPALADRYKKELCEMFLSIYIFDNKKNILTTMLNRLVRKKLYCGSFFKVK